MIDRVWVYSLNGMRLRGFVAAIRWLEAEMREEG